VSVIDDLIAAGEVLSPGVRAAIAERESRICEPASATAPGLAELVAGSPRIEAGEEEVERPEAWRIVGHEERHREPERPADDRHPGGGGGPDAGYIGADDGAGEDLPRLSEERESNPGDSS
jgi:hypothetical protein